MKKILIGIAVLLLSLLLFGCSGGEETKTGDIYIGGTRGLEFSFITPFGDDSTGKDVIYNQNTNPVKSEPFDIVVNVKNQGEADVAVGDLKIKLTGINQDEFDNIVTGMSMQNSKLLAKIEPNVNYFDEEDISFRDKTKTEKIRFNRNILQEDPKQVTAQACYKYNTVVSSSICFRDSKNKLGSCENINPAVSFSVSGAPIQVTKIAQSPSSGKINVNIEIKNVGSGQVYQIVSGKTCNFNQDNRDSENKIGVTVISRDSRGTANMQCDEMVRIVNGVGNLKCWRDDIDPSESYSEQVTIQFDYQYQQSTMHPFSIYNYGRTQ